MAGKLIIILWVEVGCQTSITFSQISTAKLISVPVKLSGEYSKVISVFVDWDNSFISLVPVTAISIISFFVLPKTTLRWSSEVELYRCIIAFDVPSIDSKVFFIRWVRACVRTWGRTFSGIIFLLIKERTNSNSIFDGKVKAVIVPPERAIDIDTAALRVQSDNATIFVRSEDLNVFVKNKCQFEYNIFVATAFSEKNFGVISKEFQSLNIRSLWTYLF